MAAPHSPKPDCGIVAGYSETKSDGTLVIHIRQPGNAEVVESHAPGSKYYDSYLAWAGNPKAGEQKPIPPYRGMVSMRDDGILVVTSSGGNAGGLVSEPSTGWLRPGTAAYQDMMKRVGAMRPGEFRGIPVSLEGRCGSGSATHRRN